MTILASDQPYSQYTGTGERTFFEYGFIYNGNEQIFVEVNAVPVAFTEQSTGVVLDVAPPLGATVVIFRNTPITQERDFTAFDSFNAAWTEDALDKLIMLKQEAAAFRADLYLGVNQYVDRVWLHNVKGTSPTIYLWNDDRSGVFSGEVTDSMPNAGSIVDKPSEFVYFQYGGEGTILSEILTTTLYPIEAREGIEMTFDVDEVGMFTIPEDEITLAGAFVEGEKQVLLISAPVQEDEITFGGAFVSGTKEQLLLTVPTQEDEITLTPNFISGTKDKKLVTAYTPDEGLEMSFDVDASECSMTAV